MGVVNPIQRLGASRSLYSIADYFSFNPALLQIRLPAAPGNKSGDDGAGACHRAEGDD